MLTGSILKSCDSGYAELSFHRDCLGKIIMGPGRLGALMAREWAQL